MSLPYLHVLDAVADRVSMYVPVTAGRVSEINSLAMSLVLRDVSSYMRLDSLEVSLDKSRGSRYVRLNVASKSVAQAI